MKDKNNLNVMRMKSSDEDTIGNNLTGFINVIGDSFKKDSMLQEISSSSSELSQAKKSDSKIDESKSSLFSSIEEFEESDTSDREVPRRSMTQSPSQKRYQKRKQRQQLAIEREANKRRMVSQANKQNNARI